MNLFVLYLRHHSVRGVTLFFCTIAQQYSLFCLSLYQFGLVFFQNFCMPKENLHIGHGIIVMCCIIFSKPILGPLEPHQHRAVHYK